MTCGIVARGAEEPCPLPPLHKGYHADPRATFTCDGCGRVRRGSPTVVGPEDSPYEGIGLCFLCSRPVNRREYEE